MQPIGFNLDVKERVKEASDLVEVATGYMELRRQGPQYVSLCPWHADTKPSLQFNPVKQIWKCWVCNIGGDVFDFVMRYESVEFREALEILANRAGIPLTQSHKKIVKGSVDDKQALFSTCAWAENEFHQRLLKSPEAELAREYLADRGISDNSIEAFRIGFAPDSFSWLMDRARHTQHSIELLEACDLVKARNSGGFYDTFRARLIFPIHDTKGRAIAFGGRVIPGFLPPEKQSPAKYLNSRETRLFSKSDTLYGIDMITDDARRQGKLTIVEGYTDVVGAWQSGLRNVIAVLGTALNERHIKTLKRFANQITLVLDGDTAGQTRANEVLDLFVANNVDLRILTLPEGLDPFDFLNDNGKEPFEAMVAEAPDAVEHKIQSETRGIDLLNDTHAANQALERILQTVARMPTSIFSGSASKVLRQDQLLMRLARKFSLQLDQIRSRVTELRNSGKRRPQTEVHIDETQKPTYNFEVCDHKERELILLVLTEPSLFDVALENVLPTQFSPGPLREIYETAFELFHEGHVVNFDSLLLRLEDSALRGFLSDLKEEAEEKKQALETTQDYRIGISDQMTLVIGAFHAVEHETQQRATISQLQQGVNEENEVDMLMQLLEQKRMKQN